LKLRISIYDNEKKIESSTNEIDFYVALKKRNVISASMRYRHELEIKKQLKRNIIEKRQLDFRQITESINNDRTEFLSRKVDYKRGNLLDNFVRNELFERIVNMFQIKCVSCERQDELTLDHFWLPKNEGGNFIML